MTDHPYPSLEPDRAFVADLEQRLADDLRRRARFAPAPSTTARLRTMRTPMLATAALMLVSLLVGATGTYAVVHQDSAPQRELHVERASILRERALLRVERFQADLAETAALVERGMVDDSTARRAQRDLRSAEAELRRRTLDLEETRITGRAPVDDLAAPLVEGRDFVRERLDAQRDVLLADLELAVAAARRMELLAKRNFVSDAERDDARAALDAVERRLRELDGRLALRRGFIAGTLTAAEVERRSMLVEAETARGLALSRLEHASAALQRVEAMRERGLTSEHEHRLAVSALRDAESALRLADVQLRMMRARIDGASQDAAGGS